MLDRIKNSIPNLPKEYRQDGALFKTGKDYSVAVTLDGIRHMTEDKGLTKADVIDYLDRFADTIVDFDSVYFDCYTDSYKKTAGLLFKKLFSDDTLISYDIVSQKKRSVVLQSLYLDSVSYKKRKSAKTLPMQNLGRTPVVRAGQTSFNTSISESPSGVKTLPRR